MKHVIMKRTYDGTISGICKERNWGLIYCKSRRQIYRLEDPESTGLKAGDQVNFSLSPRGSAEHVRKVYINMHGIEFVPRFNTSHLHPVPDRAFYALINNIGSTDEAFIELEHQFPHMVGLTSCVLTNDGDDIVYAIRRGRKGHSRLVLNRKPDECDTVFGAFKRDGNRYIIITTYVGRKNALEPWDQRATEKDLSFWKDHALIYDSFRSDIIHKSSCRVCPWQLNQPSISTLNIHNKRLKNEDVGIQIHRQ